MMRAQQMRRAAGVVLTCCMAVAAIPEGRAQAQAPPPPAPPPPAAPPPAPPAAAPPAAVAPPLPVLPPPVTTDSKTVVPVPEPPPKEATMASMSDSDFRVILDKMIPNIHFGMKFGGTVATNPATSHTSFQLDQVYVEPRFSGKVFDWLSWVANFNANGGSYGKSGVGVMDLIAQLNFHDAFHIWAGHLLVPFDRANFSGPFFMDDWNYPGTYGGNFLVGPNTGPYGRDTGASVWGQFLGAKLHYFLGAFNYENFTARPKVSGRISVDILGSEDGYFGSSTFYGSQNILAIGGGFQFWKDGETGPAPAPTLSCVPGARGNSSLTCTQDPAAPAPVKGDLTYGVVDLLAEGKFGGTLEAAFYHFDSHYPVNNAYYASLAYLLPWEIGVGKLRPSVRFQQAFMQPSMSYNQSQQNVLDASLTYVVRDYDVRFNVDYHREQLAGAAGSPTLPATNAFQFGVRIQK